MFTFKYSSLAKLGIATATLSSATAVWAHKVVYDLVVSNNAAVGSTKIGVANPDYGPWVAGTELSTTAPSTQKTIGASKTRQAVMYKKADGNTYLVDGQIGRTTGGGWCANFDESSEVAILADPAGNTVFKQIPEEIEIEPTTNDVFVLSAANLLAPRQIFRIKNVDGANIATAMTFHKVNGAITPNLNRAFVNPGPNGYKSGSIAFVPKPSGGQYLVFTHHSTVYQGICHWVYVVKTGAKENELWAAEDSNNVSMNKCQKSNSLTGFPAGTTVNTTYVGPQTISATSGGVQPGRLVMSRDNGPMFEVKGIFDSVPWSATQIASNPAAPLMSNDLAWWRNYN